MSSYGIFLGSWKRGGYCKSETFLFLSILLLMELLAVGGVKEEENIHHAFQSRCESRGGWGLAQNPLSIYTCSRSIFPKLGISLLWKVMLLAMLAVVQACTSCFLEMGLKKMLVFHILKVQCLHPLLLNKIRNLYIFM